MSFVVVSLGSGIEQIIENNNSIPSMLELLSSAEIYLPVLGFVLLISSAFLSIAIMAANGTFPMLTLISLLASYFAINIVKVLYKYYDNRLLQPANAGTINLHAITGILFCIGIWLGSPI